MALDNLVVGWERAVLFVNSPLRVGDPRAKFRFDGRTRQSKMHLEDSAP